MKSLELKLKEAEYEIACLKNVLLGLEFRDIDNIKNDLNVDQCFALGKEVADIIKDVQKERDTFKELLHLNGFQSS